MVTRYLNPYKSVIHNNINIVEMEGSKRSVGGQLLVLADC